MFPICIHPVTLFHSVQPRFDVDVAGAWFGTIAVHHFALTTTKIRGKRIHHKKDTDH
jgi:hypothetical protein